MIKLLYLEILYGSDGARGIFEDLCYELIRSQFPELEVRHIQRKQGDGGIDVYVGDLSDPNGIEVLQAKFLMPSRKLCKEELPPEEVLS